MKVLLINPAFYDKSEFKNRYSDYLDWVKGGNLYIAPFEPPLGLAYLTAYLKKQGESVELIDMQGLMMDSVELVKRIEDSKADLIGITSMTTTFPAAIKVAGIVREKSPKSKIILGGVHPTIDPEGVLAHHEVDFVIRGEGEEAIYGLVKALKGEGTFEEVDGLCYRDGENYIIKEKAVIEDTNSIPMPDYDAFPVEQYIKHNQYLRGMRGISVLISRGCPFDCTFCAVHQTMGRKWRVKSPELLVNDIITLKNKYNLDGIWFKDSIFNMNKKWIAEFCNLMIEKKVNIAWQINTRIDLVDEEQIKLMKKAGLTQIDFGVESGSNRTLERLHKHINVDEIKEKIDIAHKYVKVFGFFMIGVPGEKEEDVLKTFELAKELNLDTSSWSIYSPLPGSTLYDELVKEGKVKKVNFEFEEIHFTKAYEGICEIPPKRLKELYKEINEYFYKKSKQAVN
ncbi:B12-binding domain-containing radical SAM protein [Clostridium pasteurianum]|uniref:Fe-S oxidoreductase n=1 Tax=Clostridium pasteurianum BC1 TaxID=86416 RepID=R4K7J6_CLOPA|nr:radical SAM protein [Clostridium pasteurianum]AGK98503.1 Fe-S oxidoreductase [Clostridium pasteurianum BC1]